MNQTCVSIRDIKIFFRFFLPAEFESFQNIAFTTYNLLFDGRGLKNILAKNILKNSRLHSIITSPQSVKKRKESMLLELFIRVVQLFILASNLTRSRGNELKISAFVSVALLCINIGEYEKLGKIVLLGQSFWYARGT